MTMTVDKRQLNPKLPKEVEKKDLENKKKSENTKR